MDPNIVLVVKTDEPVREAARVAEAWSHLHGNRSPVLFKPNLINHRHLLGGDFEAVVTQPSVLDLAWAAADLLELSGTRAVADAPQGDADFDILLRATRLDLWGRDRGVRIVDLRQERFEGRRDVIVARHSLPGDPMGGVLVDLGRHSAFYGVTGRTYYGADYDIEYTNRHHQGESHVYSFSGTALNSGVVIDLPKLKTHKKAGVTLSLKNLVGLNTDKNLLPHHSLGTPKDGGDAYDDSRAAKRLEAGTLRSLKPLMAQSRLAAWAGTLLKPVGKRVLGDTQQVIRSGNWWGNDT